MIVSTFQEKIFKYGGLCDIDFSIQDPKVIFSILTTHLYQHPLRTAIQEYISNARDAQIEAGTIDKPISIRVDDNYVSIRDYGVGLSPERIEQIFVKLGASTKNETNDQLGGFGIGAKSGFAYSKTFTITSYFDNIERQYLAYIDDDGLPKLRLLFEKPSNEHNGVKVTLPLKDEDFRKAKYYVFRATLFDRKFTYDTNIIYKNYKITEFENFIVCEFPFGLCTDLELRNNDFIVVVDNIPYLVDLDDIFDDIENLFTRTSNSSSKLVIYANIGDVDITATREQLALTEKTKRWILERLTYVYEEMTSIILDNLKNDKRLFVDVSILPASIKLSDKVTLVPSMHEIEFSEPIETYKVDVEHNYQVRVSRIQQNIRSISSYTKWICTSTINPYRFWLKQNLQSCVLRWAPNIDEDIKSVLNEYNLLIHPKEIKPKKEKKSSTVLVYDFYSDKFTYESLSDIDLSNAYYVEMGEDVQYFRLTIIKQYLEKYTIIKTGKNKAKQLKLTHISELLQKMEVQLRELCFELTEVAYYDRSRIVSRLHELYYEAEVLDWYPYEFDFVRYRDDYDNYDLHSILLSWRTIFGNNYGKYLYERAEFHDNVYQMIRSVLRKWFSWFNVYSRVSSYHEILFFKSTIEAMREYTNTKGTPSNPY